MPSVLIVDDHEGFREAARSMLDEEGFDVIEVVGDGRGAVVRAIALVPDVVLLDIQLPDIDGFAVARQLATAVPATCVVLVSSRDAETFGDRLESTPARGFLAKRELTGAALMALIA